MLFFVLGAVSAVDLTNVSNSEDSNLEDSVDSLSTNKLEISSEDSISETNIINSHDDNLGDYSDDEVLNDTYSYYENNQSTSDIEVVGENTLNSSISSTDSVIAADSSNNFVSAGNSSESGIKNGTPISTKLTVSDTHYKKSATYFTLTLSDADGNPLTNQKVFLTVNKKAYSAYTNSKGIATIKTASLAVGSYSINLNYNGNSDYSHYSTTKKVKVLSSIIGSDLTKTYGYISKYKVKFWKANEVLANTNVTFKVNGKTYTRTTNDYGNAVLNINLAVGKYTITAINPYSKEMVSHNIVVKKEKTNFDFDSKKYISVNKKGSFTVTLKSAHNILLKNKKISFTYGNKKVTSKTNANGKATVTIPVLSKGTHKITFKYGGSKNYKSKSDSASLVIFKPTTKLSSSYLVMKYNDGSKFKVKLTNDKGKNLANKTVNIKINGKSTICKTNKYGNAKLKIKDLKPGVYKVSYSHSKKGSNSYSHGSSKVIVIRADAVISAKNLKMEPNDGSTFNVVVKDKSGKVLKDIYVKSIIDGKSYLYKTDSSGVAKLKITNGAGYYKVKTVVTDSCYKSTTLNKYLTVKGYKFVAENKYSSPGGNTIFSVKLVTEKNIVVKNAVVNFIFEGKIISGKTNSKGIAQVNLGVLSKGTHKIKFDHESASGSAKIFVVNKVTIKDIVTASKTVKKYISKYNKLPSTVNIGDIKVTTAVYLYLASKAVVNLKTGGKSSITFENIDNPTNPKGANNLGHLSNYLSVAKKIVKTSESKGKLPNSVSSQVGTIGYDGLVSAFSRILVSYDKYGKMPKYVYVKSLSGGKTKVTGNLNSKNTIGNLAAYLAASKNCEVNDAKIKKLVTKLTKNCGNDKEKADAIFKYVRDAIGYSFYYNTKYGAAGTLKTKSGNCVDLSHLLVAMYRNAGLAARYGHGKCTFSSGNTYGHVWTQVLIGNTWTVADATSSRNSLGHVANWNVKSYSLEGYFSSISF